MWAQRWMMAVKIYIFTNFRSIKPHYHHHHRANHKVACHWQSAAVSTRWTVLRTLSCWTAVAVSDFVRTEPSERGPLPSLPAPPLVLFSPILLPFPHPYSFLIPSHFPPIRLFPRNSLFSLFCSFPPVPPGSGPKIQLRRLGPGQGRIIHCAGCTMGGGPRRKQTPPPPISCQRSSTFLGKKCTATDKKILASRTRKGPPPYFGMGPRMVNPALALGNAASFSAGSMVEPMSQQHFSDIFEPRKRVWGHLQTAGGRGHGPCRTLDPFLSAIAELRPRLWRCWSSSIVQSQIVFDFSGVASLLVDGWWPLGRHANTAADCPYRHLGNVWWAATALAALGRSPFGLSVSYRLKCFKIASLKVLLIPELFYSRRNLPSMKINDVALNFWPTGWFKSR